MWWFLGILSIHYHRFEYRLKVQAGISISRPPALALTPGPQFIFTGVGPQFVFTSYGTQFVFVCSSFYS